MYFSRNIIRTKTVFVLSLLFAVCGPRLVFADQNFSQQVFFENSLSPASYFYSEGAVSAPSTLTLVDKKIPIETTTFISGPNALDLQWQSMPNGGWDAELNLYVWRDRIIDFPGNTLFLWLYTKDVMQAADLPRIALRSTNNGHTASLSMRDFAHNLEPNKWTRVGIPLAKFTKTSLYPFDPHHLTAIVLLQGDGDAKPHQLYIDDIRIEDSASSKQRPPAMPKIVEAKGYERHV